MPRLQIPEKAIKILLARNERDPKKTKQDLAKQIGSLITSKPIMFMDT
jgi:hypothetical protein